MPSERHGERRLTVLGAVERAADAFLAAGIAEPRREATRLVADLLDWSPAEVALSRAHVIEPDRRRWIDRAVGRRVRGEPLAYVTGLAGFRNLVLRSDPRALIPRPETEGIVDRALARQSGGIAIDVGTGTGCLALSLREEGAFAAVVAIDRSREALALADQNRRRTGLGIELVRGDLLGAVGRDGADLIVSNPPYLTEAEYLALDPAVRNHEPALALVSGWDGLDATRRVLSEGLEVVRSGGVIVLEIAADRPKESVAVATAAGWTDVTIDDDLFGRPRYLMARRGS